MTLIPTVKWFGESWGAPVCDPEEHRPTPVGDPCARCDAPIAATDQGIIIHHLDERGARPQPHHLDCFLRSILPHHLDCFLRSILPLGPT